MPALIERLNIISNEIWDKWYYDIQLDAFDVSSDERSAVFSGNGRWAFCHNLEALGRWTAEGANDDPKLGTIYSELLNVMSEEDLYIEVSYSDEEGGNHVLYRQTGILSSDGDSLVYKEISNESFDYNWKNYMDVTSDTENFNLLVESLCGKTGLENDKDGLVEHWAKTKTFPHVTRFEELNEEQQSDFKRFMLIGIKEDE